MSEYNFQETLRMTEKELREQDAIYKPTAFWASASEKISRSLTENGVDTFRSNPLCLGFFVPNYGPPTNGISIAQKKEILASFQDRYPENEKGLLTLEQHLNGYSEALANWRVLRATDDPRSAPHLESFSESLFGDPLEQHLIQEQRYSRSALNYLLGLVMLKRHLARCDVEEPFPAQVLEIGGGFGSLGEILSQSGLPDWRYIDIDIPPTGNVAEWYLRKIMGDVPVFGYRETSKQNPIDINSLPKVSVFMPWQLPRIEGKIDLFVNYISFQEMEPHVVKNYLRLVTRLKPKWVLLRNLKEGKQRRKTSTDVGVDEPIVGDDYVRMLPDYTLVERGTLPFGYLTVDNFHSELLLFKRSNLIV